MTRLSVLALAFALSAGTASASSHSEFVNPRGGAHGRQVEEPSLLDELVAWIFSDEDQSLTKPEVQAPTVTVRRPGYEPQAAK